MNSPDSIPASSDVKVKSRPMIESETWSENAISLIHGGKSYFNKLIELINSATGSIHLQTYIYDDDETGRIVGEALMSAARRNVSVHLLADGYASQIMSRRFINELRQAGIHFRYFEPLFRSQHFYFGRRLHHKVFVADAMHALVGGINIADRYNDLPGKDAWLDYSLYVQGEVARQICVLCRDTWNNSPAHADPFPCDQSSLGKEVNEKGTSLVRMRRNDWVKHKNEISATYIQMLRNAHSHITIMCSYFIPGKVIRRLLRDASRRGVHIQIITSGPSDVMLAKYAERWLYDWLLRYNIELYEYQSNVLHAKVAVCDGEWFTLGSYNINDVSAYASIELNLDVRSSSLARDLERDMKRLIADECLAVTHETHIHSKNMFKQFSRWVAYSTISVIFNLLTFYFKQSKS